MELISTWFHREGKIINEKSEREEMDAVIEITSVYLAFFGSKDSLACPILLCLATTIGGRYSHFTAGENKAQELELKKNTKELLTWSHMTSQHSKSQFNARI